ncbi:fimbrial protein [Pseudomonas chlororaphis]|uniref:Fimbrial protein n=1 Tax=Pseudomonas chlororaphis TaxID=587753 RepID=A0A1Q8EP28_9PSED|nr:fimbrial protein [Pseudomonas chlororaphis]OLF53550.1 fimbrial protein [Pseudomonas chlororaphis]
MFPQISAAALADVCRPVGSSVVSVPLPATITAQRDLAVGGVLASVEVKAAMSCNNIFFPTGWSAQYFKSPSNVAVGLSRETFLTGVNGVGLRWTLAEPNGGRYSLSNTGLNNSTPVTEFGFPYLGGTRYYTLQHTFELIKLGDIAGGSFRFPNFSVMTRPSSALGGLYDQTLNSFSFSTVQVAVASCSLVKNSILVKMGRVDIGAFRGAGSSTPEKGFSIDLRCDAGARVNLTLDNTSQVSGYPGTIRLTSSGQSARGVGIQILDASKASPTPMPLGQRQALGTAENGVNSIKLAARYIQIGSNVSGGKADGSLTFILNYL